MFPYAIVTSRNSSWRNVRKDSIKRLLTSRNRERKLDCGMATGACSAGAITGGVVAVVNDSSKEDEVVDNIKYTICGIIASSLFDKKAIQQRSLKVTLEERRTSIFRESPGEMIHSFTQY